MVLLVIMHQKYCNGWMTQGQWFMQSMTPLWSNGSVLDHRSLPPMFESWHGHIWMLFHLWFCLITFGGRLAHLAYHVHEIDHKTPIIIMQSLLQQLWVVNRLQYQWQMCLGITGEWVSQFGVCWWKGLGGKKIDK